MKNFEKFLKKFEKVLKKVENCRYLSKWHALRDLTAAYPKKTRRYTPGESQKLTSRQDKLLRPHQYSLNITFEIALNDLIPTKIVSITQFFISK